MNDATTPIPGVPESLEITGTLRRERPPRKRRTALAAAGTVGLAAVAGGGWWAWQAWTEQGPQPAEALPGNTLAYVAIDLDPPGNQKVGALDVIGRFPTLGELELDSEDGVRREVLEEFAREGTCDLDYAKDVDPWVGDRMAAAVVDQKRPELVFVLQVKDADGVAPGLDAALADCENATYGYAVQGDWVVLARTTDVAERVVADAKDGTLADDTDFRQLTESAGDPGFATAYAAPEAGPTLLEEVEKEPFLAYGMLPMVASATDPVGGMLTSMISIGAFSASVGSEDADFVEEGSFEPADPPFSPELEELFRQLDSEGLTDAERRRLEERIDELLSQQAPLPSATPVPSDDEGYAEERYDEEVLDEEVIDEHAFAEEPELPAALRAGLEDFTGIGGVARFRDGGVELEVVSDEIEGTLQQVYAGQAGDDAVADLPRATALTTGFGLVDGWAGTLLDQFAAMWPPMAGGTEDAEAAFTRATGLDVATLEQLGGDAVTLVAGAGLDVEEVFDDPSQAPIAALVTGDPARIEEALGRVLDVTDAPAGLVSSRRTDSGLLVGPDAGYLGALADGGDLGDSERYRDVVRGGGDAERVLYVDFDAGDWLVGMAESERDKADAKPLRTLGLTVHDEGDTERTVVRLTFD